MYGWVAGAASTLAGLLFVAVTVNLPRILPDAAHVARAREALGGLLSLLVMALLVLIPHQPVSGAGGGLYWLVATVLVYFLRSSLDAWALVVEAAATPTQA
jgi:hypothetical protein